VADLERFDVLVIGGSQAGLAMGYHLQAAGISFVIVDGHPRTGDSWRRRWDSLELFTPRPFAQLPGLNMPRSSTYYPRRDDVADYLEQYRERFQLPVRNGFQVHKLETLEGEFVASSPTTSLRAKKVVLATGPFHSPRVPECATKLNASVWQGHSHTYRRPSDVPPRDVLVVGGGNSAGQLAEELSVTHRVTTASNGMLISFPKSILGVSIFWLMHLTGYLRVDKDSWIGRHARPYSDTIIGMGLKRLIRQGAVAHVPHAVVDCEGSRVTFADGSQREFPSILWCTGYEPEYNWVKIDGALDGTGAPRQERGMSPVPGLFWLGLAWQCRLNSALINGVATDARRLMPHLLT
jgi:putative flavoprotein involved in K+ transport